MDDLTPIDAVLIEIGCSNWRRWMIYHRTRNCYWHKGQWRRRRRDGELWHDMNEAGTELDIARQNWEEIVIEDDEDE